MKVSQIRKILERWAEAQNHAGAEQQALAIRAFSDVMAKADKMKVMDLAKKMSEASDSKTKN